MNQTADGAFAPFGVGPSYVNARSPDDLARWIPAMKAIGVDVLRTTNAYWGTVEPRRGQWDWRALDASVSYLQSQNITFGILLHGNPSWNTSDAGLPVNNLAGWSNYVKAVATRMRGKVRCFQVWNEPPNNTGNAQTAADYARVVQAAYRAVKAVDPSMKVGLATKSAHVNYLEQVIRAGAANHYDYITLHPYESLAQVAQSAHPAAEAAYLNIVPAVRRMLASANPERRAVPIAYSEVGISATEGESVQASGLVKAYVLGIAQGVAGIQWFEGRDGDSGPLGLVDAAGRPRQAYRAMETLIRHLGRTPRYAGWLLLNGRHPAVVFEGPLGPVAVAWTATAVPRETVAFTQPVTVVNPLRSGVQAAREPELSRDPVLLTGIPASMVAKAATNRARPLRWDPDYAGLTELYLDYGTRTTSGGLYTMNDATVAASVVAYGGNARAGDVPGGQLFVVHPSFLNNARVPLEITVEVRRKNPAVSAGFNLKYEALTLTGFKGDAGGWYTIPADDRWHKKTWRISDASFVWNWGYNFTLDSDGVHHQYAIRSIRVRKLGRTPPSAF